MTTSVGHRIPSPVLEYGKDPTAVLLKDEHQPVASFYLLDQMRRRNQFCDVFIKLESARLPAHKVVLASGSPYLMKRLTSTIKTSEIALQDSELDVSALEMLVEFIYTSVLRITEGSVKALCYAARLLQLDRIERACGKFMAKNLTAKNCVDYLLFAEEHAYPSLLQASQEFVLKNLLEVAKTAQFQGLPTTNLLALLKAKSTTSCPQQVIVASLLQWVKHDIASRQKELCNLLACIRLPVKPEDPARQDQLLEAVLKDEHLDVETIFEKLRACFKRRSITDEAEEQEKPESDRQSPVELCTYETGSEEAFEEVEPEQPVPTPDEKTTDDGAEEKVIEEVKTPDVEPASYLEASPKATANTFVFAVGGTTKHSVTSSVERYDSSSCGWVTVTSLPKKKSHASLIAYKQKLISIGGFSGTRRLSSVETYDHKTDTWEETTPMPTPRSDFGVAVVGRHAFCIGGFDGVTDLATTEILDLRSKQWRNGPSLQQPRSYVQAAELGGAIYAVGGLDGSSRLASVEKLEIRSSTNWSIVANLNIPRSRPGVVALGGKLYAVGGYSGSEHLNSVECYDPQIDRWSLIETMGSPRNSPGVCVMDGCLLVAGGHDGRKVVRSVERYNPRKKEWSRLSSMQVSRCDFDMAAIQTAGSLITTTWT